MEVARIMDGSSKAMPSGRLAGVGSATAPGVRATVPGLTEGRWRELQAAFGDRCRYCGGPPPLQRDHRVPLARGGPNEVGNIVPACAGCNSLKGTATEDEYLALVRRLHGRVVGRLKPRAYEKLQDLAAQCPRESRSATLFREIALPEAQVVKLLGPESGCTEAVLLDRAEPERIAGISFQMDAVNRILGERDEVKAHGALVPELDNPHDREAIGVWLRGQHIGYVPAAQARGLHDRLLDVMTKQLVLVGTQVVLFRGKKGVGGRVYLSAFLELREP